MKPLLNPDGSLALNESTTVEFKEGFPLRAVNPDVLYDCVKVIASFANTKGGTIYFGIKDNPRKIVGAKNFDFEQISDLCRDYLEPQVIISPAKQVINRKTVYLINVEKSYNKPIICRKNAHYRNKAAVILRSGAVYYRYYSSSKEIDGIDILNIINERISQEHLAFLQNLELTLKNGGPRNVAIASIDQNAGVSNLFINEETAKKINFIREGRFEEKSGLSYPAYRVVSDVKLNLLPKKGRSITVLGNNTHTMNYTTLGQELGVNGVYIPALVWNYKLSDHPEMYFSEKIGKREVHRFSLKAVTFLKKQMKGKDVRTEAKLIYKRFKTVGII
jgi:hypothetical protein